VVFAGLATTLESASGQEGFSPESEEIEASERIGELFGDSSTTSVMQVIVQDEGGDVLTREALEVVASIGGDRRLRRRPTFMSTGPDQPGVSATSPPSSRPGGPGI
jgi:hypothetical protein